MRPDKNPSPWQQAWKKKLIAPEQLEESIRAIRSLGKSIATLNGSFDLMHAGHLYILYEASKQADILIVALNTDNSIQRYKSPDRPIIPLEYRLQMMAAIGWIDHVTFFDETDPRALLEKIRPDVHVNGAEYGENCIEAQTVKAHGGKIHIVDILPGLSTSHVMSKIEQILLAPRQS